ncbi:hypothetical protein [Rugamonas sp. DEMB1]|uniref:hypothetical protein n=1 Tax=Rugamonas sp. DEMB1 TaxID=3039386 RepID=UPI00244A3469|nr:hypothetical protein [Rugamonas sp. DEMB1]WGG52807.1 hypothetical protein QC826_12075 [Rugamonas sp. DEMB1]
MISNIYKSEFLRAANEWICESYSATLQYIILKSDEGESWLAAAVIAVNPLESDNSLSFSINAENISAGQIQLNNFSKSDILAIIADASIGKLFIDDKYIELSMEKDLGFHSEMYHENRWFCDLHLQIIGPRPTFQINIDFTKIDNQLRASTPPFDGLSDLGNWLSLTIPRNASFQPSINLRIAPPVDIMTAQSSLENDELRLVVHAHPSFDINKVAIAVRAVPGQALTGRRQAASELIWGPKEQNPRRGVACIKIAHADNALAILMLGQDTVRRNWFIDPYKARNSRLLATGLFDNDLRRLKKAIFETSDSREFEKGIGSLSFLLGLTPALQVESDAPDLIITTPNGRIALVECTLRIADFQTKLGKLVDRSRALSKFLASSNHNARVYSILICALPKDQITFDYLELQARKVTLITKEDLLNAFEKMRFPIEPDSFFDTIDAIFLESMKFPGGLG